MSLAKAFQSVREKSGKVKEFIEITKRQTAERYGHHPQARAVPESLLDEDLLLSATPPQPTLNTLFVGLSTNDAAGNPNVMVSAPKNAAKIYLCRDSAPVCAKTPRVDLTLNPMAAPQGSDRALFSTPSAWAVESGKVFTLLAYDAAGQPLGYRGVRLVGN